MYIKLIFVKTQNLENSILVFKTYLYYTANLLKIVAENMI